MPFHLADRKLCESEYHLRILSYKGAWWKQVIRIFWQAEHDHAMFEGESVEISLSIT